MVTAIQIPIPMLARTIMHVKIIQPAWNQMRPLKLISRVEMAPNGKNRTKATGAKTACAIRNALKLLRKEPPPPEDELDEPELLPEGDIAAAVLSKGLRVLPPAAC